MSSIGFIILVNPKSPLAQTERLIRTLNLMFDHPPMVCHHDFGQNPRWIDHLPSNVRLCRPYVKTGWGTFGCVEATIRSLGVLYSGADVPDWYVYLSGADYPVKSASQILNDLKNSPFDGHIEHKPVSEGDLSYPPDPNNLVGYKGPTWLKQCDRRYCTIRLDVPGINRYLRPSKRTFWIKPRGPLKRFLPFTSDFKCHSGEVWYCANHRCAERLLKFFGDDVQVAKHYKKTLVPEESYPQSVLANDPSLKLSQNTYRYIDWTGGGSNPKTLSSADFDHIANSTAHFARKMDFKNEELQDLIDSRLLHL